MVCKCHFCSKTLGDAIYINSLDRDGTNWVLSCMDDDEYHQGVHYYLEVDGLDKVGFVLRHLSEKSWVDMDDVVTALRPWIAESTTGDEIGRYHATENSEQEAAA